MRTIETEEKFDEEKRLIKRTTTESDETSQEILEKRKMSMIENSIVCATFILIVLIITVGFIWYKSVCVGGIC